MREILAPYLVGIAAFFLSYSFALSFCAMVMHETGHALAARMFGFPHHLVPWTDVIILRNPLTPSWIFNLVALAGGITQSLTSFGFLLWVSAFQRILSKQSILKPKIFFGLKLSFLTVVFTGLINAIWEGFFIQSYLQSADNIQVWDLINLACGILSFCILYFSRRKSWRL